MFRCEDTTLNDCSAYSTCTDEQDGYSCKCLNGFIDASPNKKLFPGRVCNKPTNISMPPDTFPRMDDLCDHQSPQACRPNEVIFTFTNSVNIEVVIGLC